jgi:hypothetical protein
MTMQMDQSSFESRPVSLFDLVDVGEALEESKSFISKNLHLFQSFLF